MIIIGDVHGKRPNYYNIISKFPESIQIGDMGIGFVKFMPISPLHKFFRGNHDNPEECSKIPNYLGDFGVYKDMFFVSGANSIDREYRIEHISWWRNEELNTKQSLDCLKLYKKNKPKIVLSHDCPQSWVESIFNIKNTSHTRNLLQTLLEEWQPELWIFGHHHQDIDKMMGKTRVVCLNELKFIKI